MTTKILNLFASLLFGSGIATITYLALREKYDYQTYFKLGTMDEPPSKEEIDEFVAGVQKVYSDPNFFLVTHKRVESARLRNRLK